MGRAGSGQEFLVNSGSGRVRSLHLWVGLGRVKKTGPTSNSGSVLVPCGKTSFDKVNHNALFVKLMERFIPVKVLSSIENLISCCYSCVE